jgi:hypothetical protein
MPTALVIGARNLGFAVIERLLSDGCNGQATAPSVRSGSSGLSSGLDARYGLCGPQN